MIETSKIVEPAANVPRPTSAAAFLADAPLADVVTYLLDRHHTFTKTELECLPPLAQKVARVHGERHPGLAQLSNLVQALRDDLLPHLMKEEHILFPFVVALSSGGAGPARSVQGPIEVMLSDHEATRELLQAIRTQAEGFVVPADACGSFRALYDGLRALDEDLAQHIAIEESVLFPRALRLAEWR